MAKRSPNLVERALIKTWSWQRKNVELRRHALAGNDGWVVLLLEETDYKSLPALLRRHWWTRGAEESEVAERLKTARRIVRALLKDINRSALPPEIAEVVPQAGFETDQVFLRLRPTEKFKLK